MKELVDFPKWLLEKDIRAKNATSFLIALVSVVAFYFVSKDYEWFHDIQRYGAVGMAVALAVVFLILFLSTWLVYSGIAAHYAQVVLYQEQQKAIRDALDSLSHWQRGFVLRFIVEDRRQIPEFEVGQFRAAWDFEMDVLLAKGIVIEHLGRGVVYEIEPLCFAYLRDHWNPQDRTLE